MLSSRKHIHKSLPDIRLLGTVWPLAILLVIGPVGSAALPDDDPNGLTDLSLEELMDIPVVVSAARQEQKISELSVPVSVITAEDIHYSGLTTIPEILQYITGVDVKRMDRSRYAVGVRGMHNRISDRTLVLINGHYANDPFFGAPEWFSLPILMEDIERIEVVRGPSGAAWGANATTGVINIITKKPKDIPGVFGATTFNHFGDSYTHVRWAGEKDRWSWRFSAGYEDFEDSDSAGAGQYVSGMPVVNPFIGFNRFSARDFMRDIRLDTEASYQYSDQTKLSFGLGHSRFESGSYEYVGYYPEKDDKAESTRTFARVDHRFDETKNAYLQWSGNFFSMQYPINFDRYTMDEHHLDGQFNFRVGDRHEMTLGGNQSFLRATVTQGGLPDETYFPREPFSEHWGGIFLIDRYSLSDRWKLEGQIRGDYHSENNEDWSTRLSAIHALDADKNHTLRFSVARSFRVVTLAMRESMKTNLAGMFNLLTPDESLDNETVWSYEAGYTGNLSRQLTLRINSYYQRMEDLLGPRLETVGAVTNVTFDNVGGAAAYGAECELAYVNPRGKLSAWYAYNSFNTDRYGQGIRAFLPCLHKAGLTGRLFLPDDWTLNTNCVYNSVNHGYGASLIDAPAFGRVDLTVAKKIAQGRGEILLGVSDLFNKTNDVVMEVGEFAAHDTPGRTFFARVQFHF